MKKSVMCILQTRVQADNVVYKLKASGFSNNDISVLFPDEQGSHDFAHEQHTKAPEAALTGAGAGGVLGGALGVLLGMGALVIPGLGPFIAAGPVMAALGGAAAGATIGSVTGALVGLGIPEFEAKRYEGKVRGGNLLLSVHADTNDEIACARAICEVEGAEDICEATESSVPDPASDVLLKRAPYIDV